MNEIDTKDITYGSLVLFQTIPCQIVEIDFNEQQVSLKSTVTTGNFWYIDLKDLRPIPLSSEWLQRFGFTIDPAWNWKVTNTDYSIFEGALGYFCLNKTGQANGCTLTSVHQLQALIWQITRIWLSIEQKGGQS